MMEEKNPTPITARNPDGTVAKGAVLNPTGENGNRRSGFAPWSVRVEQLQTKYDTLKKLMALFVFDEAKDTVKASDELLKMNPIDAGIIWQMFGACYGDDKRLERESLWNRKEGLPKETVKHEGGIAHGLDPALLGVIREVRRAKSIGSEEATRMVDDRAPESDIPAG